MTHSRLATASFPVNLRVLCAPCAFAVRTNCGPERSRTANLVVASDVLSLLSYRPRLGSRSGLEPPIFWVTTRCFTPQLPRTCLKSGSEAGTRTPLTRFRAGRPTARRTRNVVPAPAPPGAPREIQTPDLPGRSRPLCSLSYGCVFVGDRAWLRGRGSNPRPDGYEPPALSL